MLQVIKEILEAGQSSLEGLKQSYGTLEADTRAYGTVMTESIKQKVDDILTDWAIIHSLAILPQSSIVPAEELLCPEGLRIILNILQRQR